MEGNEDDENWGDVKDEAEDLGLDAVFVHAIDDMSR